MRNGEEYVPNISHVFRQDQHMYLLYEIYDPAHEKAAEGSAERSQAAIDLLSSLELIQGSTKVYETPIVQAKAINVEGRDAVSVELDVPLSGLKPGSYICQLNVIDDAAGSFAFPRFAILGARTGRGARCRPMLRLLRHHRQLEDPNEIAVHPILSA